MQQLKITRYINRRNGFVIGAGSIAIVLAVLLLFRNTSRMPSEPMTFGAIQMEQVNSLARPAFTFWITNNTDMVLHICFFEVESKIGTNRTIYFQPSHLDDLRFVQNNFWMTKLNPHEAAKAVLPWLAVPKTESWRMKFAVSEELHGVRRFFTGAKEFLLTLYRDHTAHNPFSKSIAYMGEAREVSSQDFYGQPANRAP